jgi:hypothetical protein
LVTENTTTQANVDDAKEVAFDQFAVYDDDVEWIYESDDPQSPRASKSSVPDRVVIPRSVIYIQGVLLATVALVAFALGILVGDHRGPGPNANGVVSPSVISGRVMYSTSGDEERPDEGCVVIALPEDRRPGPNERAPATGLRPTDPQPLDSHESLRALHSMGASYTRCDGEGSYRLTVPPAQAYFVLALSRHANRSDDTPPERDDLAQLGRYFLPALELLGEQRYAWRRLPYRREQTLDVQF